MRTRMYGGVRGRKTKVGGKPTFVFLLLDFISLVRKIAGFCRTAEFYRLVVMRITPLAPRDP